MVFKSDLKRCTKCEEVFEATADPEQDVDELPCPYIDCDAEGTIVRASLADRYDQWMHDRKQTYIFYRGKVKVAVKNLYWRPVRRYNAGKRKVRRFAQWLSGVKSNSMRERAEHDLVENFDYTWSEVEDMTEDELLDAMADENQENITDEPLVESDTQSFERCPNCQHPDPDEVAAVSDDEYRCEQCIMGGD